MRRLLAAIAFAFIASACASTPAGRTASVRPWEADTRLAEQVMQEAQSRGLEAIGPHVPQLEQALAAAPQAYAAAAAGDSANVYRLTDGTSDALLAMVMATAAADAGARETRPVLAIHSPYPMISMMLGSYYVETGAHDKAVRALGQGLDLPGNGILPGETRSALLMERAVALGQLRRYAEAVAHYEEVLAESNLTPAVHGRALRGRGIALIDLNRLDEAEADLRSSLQYEPNHPAVPNELAYIARLRAGGARLPGTTVQRARPPQQ